jgi:hypothetical protein
LDVAVAMEGFFSWEVEEGVKCACSLRRIYEEVGDVCLTEIFILFYILYLFHMTVN